MKNKWISFLPVALFAASITFAQDEPPQPVQASSLAVVGVWRGQMDNLPAVVLNITDESGTLAGAALFYFHERKTVSDPYTSTPGIPEPMFNLRASGDAFRFEISHRRAHPPRTLHDPPVHFRFTLTGPNRGELVMERGGNETTGPPLLMVRGDH